jgi:hypothetical protein
MSDQRRSPVADLALPLPASDLDARPVLVHLDQWCWDHLAKDRAGRPLEPFEAGTHAFLHDLAVRGVVAFPLSENTYRENWTRRPGEESVATAVVMAELSGFNTLGSRGLVAWDADVAICSLFALAVPPPPDLLGWGMQQCFPSLDIASWVTNAVSRGRRVLESAGIAVGDEPSDEIRRALEIEVQFTMLARQATTLPQDPPIVLPTLSNAAGERFQQEQEELRSTLGASAGPRKIRDVLQFLSYRDSDHYLAEAAVRQGLPGGSVAARITDALDRGDSSELGRVIDSMPIQGAFTELRIRAHTQDRFAWAPSDCVDFLALASVAPLVDGIVVDRRTYNLASAAGLRTADSNLGIHRRLDTLCEALNTRLG